jgi:hypothetical protein
MTIITLAITLIGLYGVAAFLLLAWIGRDTR